MSNPGEKAAMASTTEVRQGVEALVCEVKALAIQMRKTSTAMHREDGLPAGERDVMQILSEHGPRTVPQIARRSLTSRQNIQMTVNRLRAEGWVEFVPNTEHKRSGLV